LAALAPLRGIMAAMANGNGAEGLLEVLIATEK
jgi:hypothetical protein